MSIAADAPQQHAAHQQHSQQQLNARLEWVRDMRGRFSPEGMCGLDGEVNQDYFKPKAIVIRLKDDEKWGPAQKEALYKGLEKYGVGKWKDMIQNSPELARYKDTDIRVHAGRLLGTQSLARHVGWKGNRAAVDAQRELHLKIAAATSCLKNGVLVENDDGSVARYLEEHPEDAARIASRR